MKTLLSTLVLSMACAAAHGQSNTNIRGTVSAFDGKSIGVATRDGKAVTVALPEAVNVSGTQAFTLADLSPGMVLGVTTVKRDGQTVAIDVRPILATARQGLSPFDLHPEATMTNAAVEGQVVSTGSGSELTLNAGGSIVKVLVPPGTPMSRAVPGKREDIKPGETIFIAAKPEADGTLTAVRVQVSINGVKPTQ